MDIRGIVNGATSCINPNEPVTVLRSTGYTIGTGAKQVPQYAAGELASGQIQALDSDDLKQLDGLNIQGTLRAIYIRGSLIGASRPNVTGGDIVQRGTPAKNWLVVKVLESWPDWTKAVIVLQVT